MSLFSESGRTSSGSGAVSGLVPCSLGKRVTVVVTEVLSSQVEVRLYSAATPES